MKMPKVSRRSCEEVSTTGPRTLYNFQPHSLHDCFTSQKVKVNKSESGSEYNWSQDPFQLPAQLFAILLFFSSSWKTTISLDFKD